MVDKRHLFNKLSKKLDKHSFSDLFNKELKVDLKHIEEKQNEACVPVKTFCKRQLDNVDSISQEDEVHSSTIWRLFFGR